MAPNCETCGKQFSTFHGGEGTSGWYCKNCTAPDTISDGFGSTWSAYCPTCKQKSMTVVRPGKVQCDAEECVETPIETKSDVRILSQPEANQLSDAEKIERLAEFMGWHIKLVPTTFGKNYKEWWSDEFEYNFYAWNPLTDENQFRQVLLKIMESKELTEEYAEYFAEIDAPVRSVKSYIKATLPTRVEALLAALNFSSPTHQ